MQNGGGGRGTGLFASLVTDSFVNRMGRAGKARSNAGPYTATGSRQGNLGSWKAGPGPGTTAIKTKAAKTARGEAAHARAGRTPRQRAAGKQI